MKKRKRDVANLDDEAKSVDDMSLDEGEIPTDGAAGFAPDTHMLCIVFGMQYCCTCAKFATLPV